MRRRVRTAIIVSLITSLSAAASAPRAPADAIKYRKAVMDGLAAHVSAFVLINFGKVEHKEYLKAHASALADLGAQAKVLFPAGTDVGDTDALPLIWKEAGAVQQADYGTGYLVGETAGCRGSQRQARHHGGLQGDRASPARAATIVTARRTTD